MEKKLERRYGLFTAICMVVGTVIGSGVFFKAQAVLEKTGGNMLLGIAAWIITGLLMIICSAMFSVMATKYQKVNGVVDYAEATCGTAYGYYLAWFLANIYYPAMAGVLAWVTARYFGVIFGWSLVSAEVMTLASLFLIGVYALNAFSPKLAGMLQVSATVIKLIPITLMAIVGVIVGSVNGTLPTNFTDIVALPAGGTNMSGLFAAIVATVFAYEGWIVATSINAELKNPKKNLPIALVVGALIVVAAYVLYFVGIAGGAPAIDLMNPDKGAPFAFSNVFGNVGGMLLNICIVISCLGTLNGLMVASTRGMYSIAARGQGPKPKMFHQVDETTNMTTNSAIWGLLVCCLWMVYFYGANLTSGWFGLFNFDSSELPIVTIYAMYIPIFIMWMVKEKDLGVFKRFILPTVSIIACGFMIFAAVYAHGITPYLAAKEAGKFSFPVLFYLVLYVVIMVAGGFFYKKKIAIQE
ncbi:MAG: APC family permease [Oscillospiraceae bacterium]|nr:APC family permease [Oscillospiraceae bacterium]